MGGRAVGRLRGWCDKIKLFDPIGCGSKLSNWGYAGFSLPVHLPGFHFGTPFLSHAQLFKTSMSFVALAVGSPLAVVFAATGSLDCYEEVTGRLILGLRHFRLMDLDQFIQTQKLPSMKIPRAESCRCLQEPCSI